MNSGRHPFSKKDKSHLSLCVVKMEKEEEQNLVFHDNVKGADSTVTYLKEKQILEEVISKEFDTSSLVLFVESNSAYTLSNAYEEEMESAAEIETATVYQINEDDIKVAELDVERVMREQTTHDLYCPNCTSCVTRRVILRKRKLKIRISDDEFKPKEKKDTEITMDAEIAVDTGIIIDVSEETSSARKEYEIEVVKSIIYGGLAESITSLGVVSSAAGGGAATLNVLALGAATLIGGLFIVCHNLRDLKYHQFEQVSNQINEQQDRYRELLGRRQRFLLHAVVAIISYITFGLVPPLVYGFSYRKSDDKQLKLVMVGATSLVCILILAIAKAYTRRPPKSYLKTVAAYLVLGFMVSGVSYVAGELVERLLNELGLFWTSSVPNVEMKPTGSGWASY